MKKYIVNWQLDNGTFGHFESSNLKTAVKDVNVILVGATAIGSAYRYTVTGSGEDCLTTYHIGMGYKKTNGKLRKFRRADF